MKKLVCLALMLCGNIFALSEWQFMVDAYVDDMQYHTEEPISSTMRGESQLAWVGPHFLASVTCHEAHNEAVYTVHIFDMKRSETGSCGCGRLTKGSVIVGVGEDASITLHAAQGQFTITFSSKI